MFAGPEIVTWSLLSICAATDLLWGKVYNFVTIPFFFAGLIFHFYVGGISSLTDVGLAVGMATLLFFPLYLLRAMAAGDVKLLMAIGAWTSVHVVLQIAGISILFGAFVGLVALLKHRGVAGSAGSVVLHATQRGPSMQSLRMPFAPGFLCAFFIIRIAELRQWQLL